MGKKRLQIRMADLCIQISYKYAYIERQCAKWLDDSNQKPDMEVETSDEEIEKEYMQTAENGITRGMCESVCIYRAIAKKLIPFSAFVMHGAVIELDGKAYVFTAKSGVGKTTHTKLWLEYFAGKASYINGDKPIIRCRNGKWYAYGTAWMGKEKFGSQKYAPIQSVCFIERGTENAIRKVDDKEVVDRLFHQLFLPDEPKSVIHFMELVDKMVREIPFFVLQCDISTDAVKVAYEVLSNS